MFTTNLTKEWIKLRNDHHLSLLNYFLHCPEKLIIVNIAESNCINYLIKTLQLKQEFSVHKNQHKKIFIIILKL